MRVVIIPWSQYIRRKVGMAANITTVSQQRRRRYKRSQERKRLFTKQGFTTLRQQILEQISGHFNLQT